MQARGGARARSAGRAPRLQDVARSKMLGVIDLRQCQVVADADALSKKAFSFAIETPQRRWLLVADSKDERNEWVTVLTFHPEYQSS